MNIHPAKLGFDIGNLLTDFIFEDDGEDKQPIVVFPGRFQPFHAGHYSVYKHLVEKYGPDRVFIATSNKVDPDKSPLSFDEKQELITSLFDIPSDNIVQVRSPYAPTEIVSKFPENTPLIVAVSEKDSQRLGGKYFQKWDGDTESAGGYKDVGYVEIVPEHQLKVGDHNISGTVIRNIFRDSSVSNDIKQSLFKKMYGKFNEKVFNFLSDKFGTPPPQIKQEPIKRSGKRMGDLMNAKIRNPETDRDIKVSSALKYDPNHPAHSAAEKFIKSYMGESVILFEGGAAGHMMHPYEDLDLQFSYLKEMVHEGLLGDFGGKASEKLDGMNIFFTVRNGEIYFARNKSHLKNRGAEAMSVDDLKQKFAGRGDIEQAFGTAGEDLQAAISGLSSEQISEIFGEGQTFVNVEIITPSTENTIPYGKNVLVFHNSHTFDEEGNRIDVNQDAGVILSDKLNDINANKQKTFGLQGPNFITFADGDSERFNDVAQQLFSEIDQLQDEYKLDDESTIGDYKESWWRDKLQDVDFLTDEEKQRLAIRWGRDIKKAIGSKDFKDPEVKSWFREMDRNAKSINDSVIAPLQSIVLRTGAMTLSRVSNLVGSHNPLAGQELQNKVKDVISKVRSSDDPDKVGELERQLAVLQNVGFDQIMPSEGLVFMQGGKSYKFTGAFAPVNRILGIMKYGEDGPQVSPRPKAQEPVSSQRPAVTEPEPAPDIKKSMGSAMNKKITNPVTKRNILVKTALGYPEEHPAHKLARRIVNNK